ncbi:hypothetical protein [Natronosalvus rutilus]|uniref:Uncharacterized protein n=1 Tax=Natronosalvus rutilus TaxID=2953753 RepID=A0A9E7NCB9_9EURY|nr:hypothetical protein [Natronosalvus rutilus]UTF54741.1 hypothetical protein NGM29_05585 [Natronosalvus rutilus]
MRDDGAWMDPSDRPILVELATHLGWVTPESLSLNLPYSASHVTKRCRTFEMHDLVVAHDEATAYRISRLGRRLLFENTSIAEGTEDGNERNATGETTLEFTDETLGE